jgi:hypothetical protein
MEIIELFDKVFVYKGMFSDVEKTIDHFEKNLEWGKWYKYGKNANCFFLGKRFESFPSKSEWDDSVIDATKQRKEIFNNKYSLEAMDIFYLATSDYVSKNNITLNNWKFNNALVCMYNPHVNAIQGMTMAYHTDYVREKAAAPGDKFGITCTMYLNDDYDGGDICFRVYDKKGNTFHDFCYKPEMGDVLVFPSGEPYFHGVAEINSGNKYFIRTFWQYEFEGTDDWLSGQMTHGEEKWEEMEKEREKSERQARHNNI